MAFSDLNTALGLLFFLRFCFWLPVHHFYNGLLNDFFLQESSIYHDGRKSSGIWLGRTGLWPCWFCVSVSYVICGKLFTLSDPWDFPGENIGVGCHFLLQGIFLDQRSNSRLLHCRQILYWLSYEGSPHLPSKELNIIIFFNLWLNWCLLQLSN